MTYIKTASSTSYQRKWEDYTFPADTRCIELIGFDTD